LKDHLWKKKKVLAPRLKHVGGANFYRVNDTPYKKSKKLDFPISAFQRKMDGSLDSFDPMTDPWDWYIYLHLP